MGDSLYKYPLACEFNGGEFIITKDSTMDSCYKEWQADMDKRAEGYYNSSEYAEKVQKDKEKSERLDSEVLILLESFEKLPFQSRTPQSMLTILNWLADYQPYSDNILCNKMDDGHVVDVLEKHGFKENANLGQNDYTCEECFDYIVGQAISTMRLVALHPAIIGFRNYWVKTYHVI